MYFSGSERVSSAMAFWIMPTWGPFPWAMMTSCPSSIRSDDSLGSLLHGDHLLREIAAQSIAAQRDHNTLTHEKHLNLFRIYTF